MHFDKIGKYKVTAKLGQGSFGVVYKGRDAYLKRDVAIKICSVEDEGLRQRFFREAEISGKLVHKNIVTVYEFGFEGKIPYLVQEILSGEDLSRIVKRRAPLAPMTKLDYLLQVAKGLGYAHTEGVIHRDIKPSNVRVLEDGRVKIMDFGIAKLASAETQLTQKGVTMGTASYLPPEQVRGSDLDHRADIFSFGVLAYELLTYERPFRGNTLSALVYQILYKVPQPMVDVWPESPEPLSQLIAKCLEKKPDRRFDSFTELLPELDALRQQAAAGEWPGLEAAPAPAIRTSPGLIELDKPREPSDVLSPTAISKTAKGVLEGKVGEYTISTAASAPDVLRPAEAGKTGHSTQPIEAPLTEPAAAEPAAGTLHAEPTAGTLPTEPAAEASITRTAAAVPADDSGLKTQIMPTTSAPPSEASSDLTLTAHEISQLVAQGHLEEAKEQLEATISRQDATGSPSPPAPSVPLSGPRLDEAMVSQSATPIRPPPPLSAAAAPPQLPAADDEPGADVAPAMTTADKPLTPSPATDTSAIASSDTYRTVIGPPLARFKWIGLAAGAVFTIGLLWLALSGDKTDDKPVAVTQPEPPPVALTPVVATPKLGAVTINALPWAELTEITDAQGYVQDLPEVIQTPIFLELPPGAYKIHLRQPEGEDLQTCDVDVTLEGVATCRPEFAELNVTEYFKESGWW